MVLAVIVIVVVAVVELTADLAAWELRAMHVGVRPAGTNQAQDLLPLSGGDAVPGLGQNISGGQRPGDSSVTKVGRIVLGAVGCRDAGGRIEGCFAQP